MDIIIKVEFSMTIIKCPECNKKVSQNATQCPKCGCHVAEILKQKREEFDNLPPFLKTIYVSFKIVIWGITNPIKTVILAFILLTFLNSNDFIGNEKVTKKMTQTELDHELVMNFQKEHGLTADGIIGPNTCSKVSPNADERVVQLCDSFKIASAPIETMIKTKPAYVCSALNSSGYESKGWTHYSGNNFGCSTSYADIGNGTPLANNIALYAKGSKTQVKEVKLMLNINQRAQEKQAQEVLAEDSEKVLEILAGQELSLAIAEAIYSKSAYSETINGIEVKVYTEEWSTGKGYETLVVFSG
ncbi:hypothetical protein J4N42_16770 [Vibrio sp. SCSIO 43135]|uniref:zinc ribbon domain-containing protein n=1 Tax=Vibrio sp. SCSIO 43135 TaxID=2819096 RepID=UPI002074CFC5|nr:DUF6030 family protein [Vibrio sp. SCSIO 43135]USD43815.1 hypothetical protein J4N42_16770 [Vibrio sp. SCSIO 43135]